MTGIVNGVGFDFHSFTGYIDMDEFMKLLDKYYSLGNGVIKSRMTFKYEFMFRENVPSSIQILWYDYHRNEPNKVYVRYNPNSFNEIDGRLYDEDILKDVEAFILALKKNMTYKSPTRLDVNMDLLVDVGEGYLSFGKKRKYSEHGNMKQGQRQAQTYGIGSRHGSRGNYVRLYNKKAQLEEVKDMTIPQNCLWRVENELRGRDITEWLDGNISLFQECKFIQERSLMLHEDMTQKEKENLTIWFHMPSLYENWGKGRKAKLNKTLAKYECIREEAFDFGTLIEPYEAELRSQYREFLKDEVEKVGVQDFPLEDPTLQF